MSDERKLRVQDLTGQALYWAACNAYGVPALIFNGLVVVEASPGNWLQFNSDDMLRSLVLGRIEVADVPAELLPQ